MDKKKLFQIKNVVLMGMFGAIGGVLMLFEFPLPFRSGLLRAGSKRDPGSGGDLCHGAFGGGYHGACEDIGEAGA